MNYRLTRVGNFVPQSGDIEKKRNCVMSDSSILSWSSPSSVRLNLLPGSDFKRVGNTTRMLIAVEATPRIEV